MDELVVKMYTEGKSSMLQISKELNIHRYYIKKILNIYNIPIRSFKEASLLTCAYKLTEHENDIIIKYKGGISITEIGKFYNVTSPVIRRILMKNQITIRTTSETSIIQFKKHIDISDELYSKIDGWLLGDGSLESTNQACFKLPSQHDEYIDYIKNLFNIEGVYVNKYKTYDYKTKKHYPRLTTCSCIEFGKLYKRWYPEGKKIVPKDLILTKPLIKNWIMDDGTLCKRDKNLTFCTHGFTKEECLFLCNMLDEFIEMDSAKINKDGKYFKIRLSVAGTKKLLNKIGNCEVKCFNYKWLIT